MIVAAHFEPSGIADSLTGYKCSDGECEGSESRSHQDVERSHPTSTGCEPDRRVAEWRGHLSRRTTFEEGQHLSVWFDRDGRGEVALPSGARLGRPGDRNSFKWLSRRGLQGWQHSWP